MLVVWRKHTNCGASGGQADGDGSFCCKLCSHQSDGGDIKQPTAYTETYPLRQKDLPILRREAQHEHAEDDEKVADNKQISQEAKVEQWSRQDAFDDEKKCLYASDPRNRGGRLPRKEGGFVVGLEDSISTRNSPLDKQSVYRRLAA